MSLLDLLRDPGAVASLNKILESAAQFTAGEITGDCIALHDPHAAADQVKHLLEAHGVPVETGTFVRCRGVTLHFVAAPPSPQWVCELCHSCTCSKTLPERWEWRWLSAVCPACVEQAQKDGKPLAQCRGGCYAAGRLDPRALLPNAAGERQPPANNPKG